MVAYMQLGKSNVATYSEIFKICRELFHWVAEICATIFNYAFITGWK